MNEYRLKELKKGHLEIFSVTITNVMMQGFMHMSGDVNPMHTDNEFPQKYGFSGKVVYGMLTSVFYSKLVGVYLPGKYALLQGVDITFQKPVYIGDELLVSGCVQHINEAYSQIEIKAWITNQEKIQISKAKIKVGVNG